MRNIFETNFELPKIERTKLIRQHKTTPFLDNEPVCLNCHAPITIHSYDSKYCTAYCCRQQRKIGKSALVEQIRKKYEVKE